MLFETFERSAFRLEARDTYKVPDEAERFAAFLVGRELPARTPEEDDWLGLLTRATAVGRKIVRVRVLTKPLTDYTRFELAVYPENIRAGRGGSGRRTRKRLRESWDEDFLALRRRHRRRAEVRGGRPVSGRRRGPGCRPVSTDRT